MNVEYVTMMNSNKGYYSDVLSLERAVLYQLSYRVLLKFAEGAGFEPADPRTRVGGLANPWFKPLTHPSKMDRYKDNDFAAIPKRESIPFSQSVDLFFTLSINR